MLIRNVYCNLIHKCLYLCVGIMEDFLDKGIIIQARKQGYLDRKYGLYGDNSSLPLSLSAHVEHSGFIQICEPPGNWGALPNGFTKYAGAATKVYSTPWQMEFKNFEFDVDKAAEVGIRMDGLCGTLEHHFKRGKYVITLVPQTDKKIMITYLILP